MDRKTATLDCNDCDDKQTGTVAEQIARAICDFQHESTGHSPTAVSVVLTEDTLVITLHEALTPAEKAMAKTVGGAAQLQEFHRQLFAISSDSLWQEIERITGRQIREAVAEVEPTSGSIVHAFTTGTSVQVFLLAPNTLAKSGTNLVAAKDQRPQAEPKLA
jgi:uncharacterized protein YbcI